MVIHVKDVESFRRIRFEYGLVIGCNGSCVVAAFHGRKAIECLLVNALRQQSRSK